MIKVRNPPIDFVFTKVSTGEKLVIKSLTDLEAWQKLNEKYYVDDYRLGEVAEI